MKKNVTVIGYGGQGGWHANHAQNSDVVSLLGVYDTDEKKRALARERGILAYDYSMSMNESRKTAVLADSCFLVRG